MASFQPLEEIGLLKPADIMVYLQVTGWYVVETNKESIALFQKWIRNDPFEIILPLSKHFLDYEVRIYDAIDIIAKAERRSIDQVKSTILIDFVNDSYKVKA